MKKESRAERVTKKGVTDIDRVDILFKDLEKKIAVVGEEVQGIEFLLRRLRGTQHFLLNFPTRQTNTLVIMIKKAIRRWEALKKDQNFRALNPAPAPDDQKPPPQPS